MAPREDLGSWLEGTPGGGGADGEPEDRPRRAGTLRRLVALAVDWTLSLSVSGAFWPDPESLAPRFLSGDSVATLAVFAVSTTVLVATLGSTVGHLLLGLRVVAVADREPGAPGGRPARSAPAGAGPRVGPGFRAALVRTALLCLVVPAAVWDRDGRGMHDVAARTAVVRR